MTVNTKKRGRPSQTEQKLTKESILSCAKSLLQETGKVPSMRKIAATLGVDPMAIYYYFPNKAAMLEGITVSLMETIYDPTGEGRWQDEVMQLAKSYLHLLGQYTGLLETMLSMTTTGPAQVFIDRFNTILAPLQLSEEQQKNAVDLLADYLHGFAFAMHCNKGDRIDPEIADGPLKMYVGAIEVQIKGY